MAFFFSKVKSARPSYGILKASTNALMPGNPHESPEYEIINKSCGALVQTALKSRESLQSFNRGVSSSFLPGCCPYSGLGRVPALHPTLLPSDLALSTGLINEIFCTPAQQKTQSSDDDSNLPSPEKLQHVHNVLLHSLPRLFIEAPDYSIYDKNLLFENKILGTKTVGLPFYVSQIALLKIVGHLRHSHIKLHVLSITKQPEKGTVKVLWRIKGLRSFQALKAFIKTRQWGVPEGDQTIWYDGYSTFYVNAEGKVTKHVADNVMRDENRVESKNPLNLMKYALFMGLMHEDEGIVNLLALY